MSKTDTILCADIGAVATKVGLIEYVGDSYRLVGTSIAPSTALGASGDVTVGVRNALAWLETKLSRRLVGADGQLILPQRSGSEGVSSFATVTSVAAPLRVALVGLSREVSLASAQRAIQGSCALLENVIALNEDARWGAAMNPEARDLGGASEAIQILLRQRPEVVVLTGGLDGGAVQSLLEMANMIAALGAAMDKADRPWVIFAGNKKARPQIAERIGAVAEFRAVDNVRPTLAREDLAPLQDELTKIFAERKMPNIGGIAALARWSPARVIPSAQGLETVARYLAKRYALNVLAVDLGGATTTVLAVKGERVARVIRPQWGLALGLDKITQRTGIDRVMSWVPGKLSTTETQTHLLNQTLHPAALPLTDEDRRTLQAAARAALVGAIENWRDGTGNDIVGQTDLCLVSGAPLARGQSFGGLALILLDALELRGIFTLAADPNGLAAAFGAVAGTNPEAAAHVIERDGFLTLGTVIAPFTRAREGSIALRVHVTAARGGSLDLDVQQGSIELLPLGVGERATVEIRPSRGVELGVPLQNGVLRREMEGGALGLVIDARGRPIQIPANEEAHREKLQQWLWDMGT